MSHEKSSCEVRPLFLCCLLPLLTDAFPSFPEVSINGLSLPDAPVTARLHGKLCVYIYIYILSIMRNSCFSFNLLESLNIKPIGKVSSLP